MSAINSEARCVLQYFLYIDSDLRLRHQIMPLQPVTFVAAPKRRFWHITTFPYAAEVGPYRG